MRWLQSAVVLMLLAACRTSPDYHQTELALHHEHVSRIANFGCHEPQQRVLRLGALLTPFQTHGKAYFPDITVLHHCDDSCGSCPPGQSCRSQHVEYLRLPFKVTFLEDMGPHQRGSWGWEYHDVVNHTVCACARFPGDTAHHHKDIYQEGQPLTHPEDLTLPMGAFH